jgi:hypothetical protein
VPLESAVAVAEENLDEDGKLVCAIDVPVARRDRYRPLPLRDGVAPPPGAGTMARKELAGECCPPRSSTGRVPLSIVTAAA